jgi:uncharacterized protein YciI
MAEHTWVALLHTPGIDTPPPPQLFQSDGFGEHIAFLERMQALGYLVAAGPLLDAPGAGMTILRLPGPDRLEEATRLATEEDNSVVTGFFSCEVRPWNVMLSA